MADFPSTPLPEYPIEETSAAPEVLVSKHRDGSEQRRLKGAGDGAIYTLRFGGSCPVTSTEKASVETHWAGENGTFGAFNWTHPETGVTLLVRYLEPPSWTLVGYNAWAGQVKLKVVPA
jgi:hypothetical protein